MCVAQGCLQMMSFLPSFIKNVNGALSYRSHALCSVDLQIRIYKGSVLCFPQCQLEAFGGVDQSSMKVPNPLLFVLRSWHSNIDYRGSYRFLGGSEAKALCGLPNCAPPLRALESMCVCHAPWGSGTRL